MIDNTEHKNRQHKRLHIFLFLCSVSSLLLMHAATSYNWHITLDVKPHSSLQLFFHLTSVQCTTAAAGNLTRDLIHRTTAASVNCLSFISIAVALYEGLTRVCTPFCNFQSNGTIIAYYVTVVKNIFMAFLPQCCVVYKKEKHAPCVTCSAFYEPFKSWSVPFAELSGMPVLEHLRLHCVVLFISVRQLSHILDTQLYAFECAPLEREVLT